jgi:ABC-2 type transport system permease protein
LQAFALLIIARLYGVRFPWQGFITVLPALMLVGLALGAIGLLLSSLIQQLENFAGVMNFVIFPLFFLSSALYPLWRMKEASFWLYWACAINPFTHGVELIRFALYGEFNMMALAVTLATLGIFMVAATISYDPRTALVKRQVA